MFFRDDQLQDLRGSFVNAVDAAVAEEAFGLVFGQIARAAVDLHAAVCHTAGTFRMRNLGGSRLDNGGAIISLGRGVADHAFTRVNFRLAVGQHGLDQLELADGIAECLAFGRIF
ncbi:hypothetical protein HME9302_00041 [Alteripontixanthobacter maritimus]|uniref:Uncharacterized protein n=1 Tax=Alteripontixanthobacter maritimus TaxID=2161824 RepID=A0A369Q6V0_9SPHN|nr:hypothetical protein HME9302_00041 [Alteripontixanthobacter maritimus]